MLKFATLFGYCPKILPKQKTSTRLISSRRFLSINIKTPKGVDFDYKGLSAVL